MSNKMDRQGSRTPADVERRYNFGKTFAEINGIATDARTSAEIAQKAAAEATNNLSHENIFNLLTNNGAVQGVFEKDGQIYINAEYVVFGELNGKDIAFTGKLTNTTEAYLEPGAEEVETIQQHILGNVAIQSGIIYRYDFNGDGVVDAVDLAMAYKASVGEASIADYENFAAVKSVVTMKMDLTNPQKAIRFTATNMWNRAVDAYVGVNFTSVKNPETEKRLDDLSVDYIVDRGEDYIYNNGNATGRWIWEKWNSGVAKLYARDNRSVAITQKWGNVYRSGAQVFTYPIELVSTLTVVSSAFGVEEAVWSGQAQLPNNTEARCEAFCGNSNASVNTNFYVEVVGKWK